MLVQEFLERSADRLPDKVALVSDGQRLTYAEIEARANRLANALMARGVTRGERVAFFLPNNADLVVGIFAALKAGGVFVVVNSTTKMDKLEFILNNCAAVALITSTAQWENARQLKAKVPSLKAVLLSGANRPEGDLDGIEMLEDALQSAAASRPPKVNIDLDLACLIYTSGSTGTPKGVMSDHSNVVFAANSIMTYLENREDDVVIAVLPLSFDYGLYQLLMTFAFGGRLVLEKGFAYPAAILKKMEEEKVTGFPGVPTIFALLVDMDLSSFDLSNLRYLTNTAAALPPSHILRIREKFPWARLYSMYGLTETKRTLYLPPEQLDIRPASVGIAIPGTEVWLEDEDGRRLPNGSTGVLMVRGRHVMRGYWNDPELTARVFRPGTLPNERVCYTGDLFRSDEEGYLYFVSRKDDIIKSRGEKVSPVEVERAIYELDGVTEVAVIGVPDAVLGQAIKAFVVCNNPAINEARVMAHCRARLEDYMVPRIIEFRAELPKTSSGKIKKTGLE